MDLRKYDIDCSKEQFKNIYEKRYKKNGEEYLKVVDQINIREDMDEQMLEISRIKEIFNTDERLKINDLINEMSNEESIAELESYKNYKELDTYEFLNKTAEIESLYSRMPEEIRKKYKNMANFTKEYIPEFLKTTKENFENIKKLKEENLKKESIKMTNEEIQNQINVLQNQLKGDKTNE